MEPRRQLECGRAGLGDSGVRGWGRGRTGRGGDRTCRPPVPAGGAGVELDEGKSRGLGAGWSWRVWWQLGGGGGAKKGPREMGSGARWLLGGVGWGHNQARWWGWKQGDNPPRVG